MDNQILIPGYQALIPNHIYANTFVDNCSGSQVLVSSIFILSRYKEPNFEDIIDYITLHADNSLQTYMNGRPGHKDSGFHGQLEELMLEIPLDKRRKIVDFETPMIDFICKQMPARAFIKRSQTSEKLVMKYGTLLEDQVRDSPYNAINPEWFDFALRDGTNMNFGLGLRWEAYLTLHKGRLPGKRNVDLFLRKHAMQSDLLSIEGICDETLTSCIGMLYEIFAENDTIDNVHNTSMYMLDSIAAALLMPLTFEGSGVIDFRKTRAPQPGDSVN